MSKGNTEKETYGHRKPELHLLNLCGLLQNPYLTLAKYVQYLIRVKTCLFFIIGLLMPFSRIIATYEESFNYFQYFVLSFGKKKAISIYLNEQMS